MKLAIGVLLLVAAAHAHPPMGEEDVKACEDESGFKIKEANEANKHSHEALCFMKCAGEKMGMIKDGMVLPEAVEKMKEKDVVKADCAAGGMLVNECEDMVPVMACMKD